jgi:hypothetical protein
MGPPSGFLVVPPIVNLTEEQQDLLNRSAFERIFEAYIQVSSAGGCELHIVVLTRLVDQCDADYDIRGILQTHILLDYQNHKGNELTGRWHQSMKDFFLLWHRLCVILFQHLINP